MDLSKTKTSVLSSLSTKKMRDKHGLFLAEGSKCVADTLGAFELDCLVAEQDWICAHPDIVAECEGKVLTASSASIKKISSLSTPPDVVAAFHLPCVAGEAFVDSRLLYLVLDGIQDPGNLGTIIRTADWFGINTIFASRDTVDVFNPKTVQSTMGSLKRVSVVYTDLAQLLEKHREMPVYGTLLEGKNLFETSLGSSGFIIMGNEGKGISKTLRGMITRPLFIPPYDSKSHGESLNVAIAAAVTMAAFRGYGKIVEP